MDSQKVVDVIKTEFLAERQVVAQFDLVGVSLCNSVTLWLKILTLRAALSAVSAKP